MDDFLQLVVQFIISSALVGSSAGGWFLPVTGALLWFPGMICMVLSIGARHNVSIGYRDEGVEFARVVVVLFAAVGVLGAVSSLFSEDTQEISAEDLRLMLPFLLIVAAPARIAEGAGWWLAFDRFNGGRLSLSQICLTLFGVIAVVALLHMLWDSSVLLVASILNLFFSALWWVRAENRIYGGIMPRVSVLMVLIGAMLFVSEDLLGQLGMGLLFAIGIGLGIQRRLLEEIVIRLS